MRAELADEGGEEVDGRGARRCLERHRAPGPVELRGDGEAARVEVEVAPADGERLGDAEPGVGERRAERPVVVAEFAEERAELRAVEVARLALAGRRGAVVAVEAAAGRHRDVPCFAA